MALFSGMFVEINRYLYVFLFPLLSHTEGGMLYLFQSIVLFLKSTKVRTVFHFPQFFFAALYCPRISSKLHSVVLSPRLPLVVTVASYFLK